MSCWWGSRWPCARARPSKRENVTRQTTAEEPRRSGIGNCSIETEYLDLTPRLGWCAVEENRIRIRTPATTGPTIARIYFFINRIERKFGDSVQGIRWGGGASLLSQALERDHCKRQPRTTLRLLKLNSTFQACQL